MTSRVTRVNDIKGLNLAFHRAQDLAPRVLSGRNFRWKANGVYSGWGSKLVSAPTPSFDPDYSYYGVFNLTDVQVLCTPHGIYGMDEDGSWVNCLPLIPNFDNDIADIDYPWSTAFVGDTRYFAHPLVGIVGYNVANCYWFKLNLCSKKEIESQYFLFETCSDDELISGPIFAIGQANNRLIVLARDTVSWSEIDNGCNLTASPYCGGGFQSSSVSEYGRPLGIIETIDGFSVWTTNSLTKYTALTGDLSLAGFNAKLISRNMVPVNPYAFVQIDVDTSIILTKSGLYSYNGQSFESFEQGVSSWLTEDELFIQASLHNQHSVRLGYSFPTNEFFISLRGQHDEIVPSRLYTRALVFSVKYKKWGVFNQPHYFFCDVNFYPEKMRDYHLGFLNQTGNFAWLNQSHSIETIHGQLPLDSYVEIGPFVMMSEEEPLTSSSINQIVAYTPRSQDLLHLNNNNNKLDDEYDRLWQANVTTISSFDLQKTHDNERETLELVTTGDSIQNFTCEGIGVYHTVKISTVGASGNYLISRIDVKLTATLTL